MRDVRAVVGADPRVRAVGTDADAVTTRARRRRDLARRLAGEGRSGLDSRPALRFGLYAAVGVVVGLVVVGIEELAIAVALEAVLDAPLWAQAIAPGIGLAATALVLGRTVPSATSDEYVRAFHSGEELPPAHLPRKLLAAIATIGSGGAAGLEGPSVYAGATIGQATGRRLGWLLGPGGSRVLTAAGAAAGVAAIFRAPATGVLFALETPFQRDVARRALIPTLIAASAAYLTFVSILGVQTYLPVPRGQVRLRDEVFGALVLGLVAGLTARGLAWWWRLAKARAKAWPPVVRVAAGAAIAAACLGGARLLIGDSVTLGPGTERTTAAVLDPDVGLLVIAGLFLLRAVATAGTLGAGGVGGVFIPLVVQGLLLGRLVEGLFDAPTPGLYPAIGLAAVLGAGYRTPLAAVMFVAETTGRAEFVIPALLATAVSQAVMGDVSVAEHQVTEREGILERRLRLPVRDIVLPVPVLLPTEPVLDVIDRYADRPPAQALPVVDADGRYLGLLVLRDLAAALFEHGPEATVAAVVQEVPAVDASARAEQAALLMNDLDLAIIAAVDADGIPVGVVTALTVAGIDGLQLED